MQLEDEVGVQTGNTEEAEVMHSPAAKDMSICGRDRKKERDGKAGGFGALCCFRRGAFGGYGCWGVWLVGDETNISTRTFLFGQKRNICRDGIRHGGETCRYLWLSFSAYPWEKWNEHPKNCTK